MKIKLFDYELPENLIAQKPATPRDSSRLLVVNPVDKTTEDRTFHEISNYLISGDVLVVNHSKVIPARIFGKKSTGITIELLLLKRLEKDIWECLAKPGKKVKVGDRLEFSDKLRATCLEITEEGSRIMQFYYEGIFEEILDELGEMPLPPYITRKLPKEEQSRYQTVYHKSGESAAAPTAGLHFTYELLEKLKEKGVILTSVMLNVGLGTFRPVQVEDTDEHKMHVEYYEITEEAAEIISKAMKENRRIIAVGTTTIRVLESVFSKYNQVKATKEWTNIFIQPGFKFQVVDCLITNFHLPQSTLLMLISAMMDREFVLKVYKEAIDKEYRFFSFGDAMFINKEKKC
ncbi:MAG: S-adenosylmethionine:tRNA ribosyltransferase-isomerase [Fusobacteria bacterium]|nr:MAG: S-adenosylmethionine:tRNA ribosyltransferase-isomerase [Fusobacteriota bacterium]KAF0229822.1 MAG: S-adenosylmethioninetRNA [Fusobacteriota bacterium]